MDLLRRNYRTIHTVIYMTIGPFILAIGTKWFIIPSGIAAGGTTGFATALNVKFGVSMEMGILVFNVLFLLLGLTTLGINFMVKTIYGTMMFPVFLSILPAYDLTGGDPLMAMIVSGAIVGGSVYFMVEVGASTGGTSIPPFVLNKYFMMPITTGIVITDGLSVASNLVIGNYVNVFYGIICIVVVKVVVDYLTSGIKRSKAVYIITDKHVEISKYIHDEMYRGTTELTARGGYSQKDRPMILTIVNSKELRLIREKMLLIDPMAFIIIGSVSEVHGEGFTRARPVRSAIELEMMEIDI